MVELLGDAATTGLIITATPEEMPVNETIELAARLKNETNVDLAAVVINRVLPELFGTREEELFDALNDEDRRHAISNEAGGSVDHLMEAASLAVALRRGSAEHLERLRSELDRTIPMLYVPFMFLRTHGMRATRQVAAALSEELGY
jgi:hypothetical protein